MNSKHIAQMLSRSKGLAPWVAASPVGGRSPYHFPGNCPGWKQLLHPRLFLRLQVPGTVYIQTLTNVIESSGPLATTPLKVLSSPKSASTPNQSHPLPCAHTCGFRGAPQLTSSTLISISEHFSLGIICSKVIVLQQFPCILAACVAHPHQRRHHEHHEMERSEGRAPSRLDPLGDMPSCLSLFWGCLQSTSGPLFLGLDYLLNCSKDDL